MIWELRQEFKIGLLIEIVGIPCSTYYYYSKEFANQNWVTDVTEFALFGKKQYLSPIIYLFNGEVISYDLNYHPNMLQVTDMLEKAFAKISNNTNLILHSDQG